MLSVATLAPALRARHSAGEGHEVAQRKNTRKSYLVQVATIQTTPQSRRERGETLRKNSADSTSLRFKMGILMVIHAWDAIWVI